MTSTRSPSTVTATQLRWVLALTSTAYFMVILDTGGAAAVLPLSLTILSTAFPPQRRGMIVGIYGGLAGLAVASGPTPAARSAAGNDARTSEMRRGGGGRLAPALTPLA